MKLPSRREEIGEGTVQREMCELLCELEPLARDEVIELVLLNGVTVRGTVAALDPDSSYLVMRTEDEAHYVRWDAVAVITLRRRV